MKLRNRLHLAVSVSLILLLAACGGTAGEPSPDRVATRVAEDLAVARTLTAVAQNSNAPTQVIQAATPTVSVTTIAPSSLPPAPPTETLPPPIATDTAIPPTPAPIVPTPLEDDPTTPGFGTSNGLQGAIVLPGYQGPRDVPVFHDAIVFRLKVSDPAYGNSDGAGIKSVTMSIESPHGTVHSRAEEHAAYCVFGNPSDSPKCDVWRFSEHNNQWPDGTPVCASDNGYQGNMTVETEDPAKSGAFWGFSFKIAGDYPPCQ